MTTISTADTTGALNATIHGRMMLGYGYYNGYEAHYAHNLSKRDAEIVVSIFFGVFLLCILVMIVHRFILPAIRRVRGKTYRVYPEEDSVAQRTI